MSIFWVLVPAPPPMLRVLVVTSDPLSKKFNSRNSNIEESEGARTQEPATASPLTTFDGGGSTSKGAIVRSMFAERVSRCCLESLIKSCACKPDPSQFSLLLFLLMAGVPAAPLQHGRGVQGQYVYAIIFPQPTAEVLATHDLKRSSEFDGQTFRELIVKCHAECDVTLVETVFFKEPHATLFGVAVESTMTEVCRD